MNHLLQYLPIRRDHIRQKTEQHRLETDDQQDRCQDQGLDMSRSLLVEEEVEEPYS